MPLLACSRSKSTGDPWLTDGSYFDGTGYAEIKFESQFGTTKRFEQEIRLVSYNGILFFLENQAGARSSREPPPLCWGSGEERASEVAESCLEQYFCTFVKSHKRAGHRPHSQGSHLSGA